MIYIFLFLGSLLLTYLIKNMAIKKSLLAIPNERSSHSVPTPHGGGIAIAITWFTGIGYLSFCNVIETEFFYALTAGFIIAVVSFFDDIYELSAKLRLLTQLLVSLLALYFLGGLDVIDLGFFVITNQYITNIFACVMMIWFINLYNFLDGIDGYAASEMLFLSLAGWLLFSGDHFMILVASVLGFLVLNWHKAKIFMGDVGSTLLGFNVGVFTIYYANQDSDNLWVWITLFGLFWFDATITLFRRLLNYERLSTAHKKHTYQRLTQTGWRHDKVVLFGMLMNLFLLFFVYIFANIFVAFIASMLLLYFVVRYVDVKKPF